MSDRDDICELHARYNHHMDSYDAEAFVELFTADGSWELVGGAEKHEGHSSLAAFIGGLKAAAGENRFHHCVFNEMIDVDGDRATARSYVMNWLFRSGEPPRLTAFGRYSDELRREGGRWRFAHRQLDCDWLERRDTAVPLSS
jgi:SnoaL-like domain